MCTTYARCVYALDSSSASRAETGDGGAAGVASVIASLRSERTSLRPLTASGKSEISSSGAKGNLLAWARFTYAKEYARFASRR